MHALEISRPALLLLVAALSVSACKTKPEQEPAPVAALPEFHPERAAVLEAIESGRLEDASATLKDAADTADVHYLRAKLALARTDGDSAYQELKRAVSLEPGYAEYQYELGVVAPLPVEGLSMSDARARFEEGGKALARAVALRPDDPKYLYARAYFVSVAPTTSGGDPKKGRKMFDELIERHGQSAWADRVRFDRAAQEDDFGAAAGYAKSAGEKDGLIGSRLWLLLAGTRLREGDLEKSRAALEAAAALNPAAAGGFCDAGTALDGGGNERLADPFWTRCLELDPDGDKAPLARERLARKALPGRIDL